MIHRESISPTRTCTRVLSWHLIQRSLCFALPCRPLLPASIPGAFSVGPSPSPYVVLLGPAGSGKRLRCADTYQGRLETGRRTCNPSSANWSKRFRRGKRSTLFSRVKASTAIATAQIVGYNHTHEQAQTAIGRIGLPPNVLGRTRAACRLQWPVTREEAARIVGHYISVIATRWGTRRCLPVSCWLRR